MIKVNFGFDLLNSSDNTYLFFYKEVDKNFVTIQIAIKSSELKLDHIEYDLYVLEEK